MDVMINNNGVEAIQLHLKSLAAKHRTRGSCKNLLNYRHIQEEFTLQKNRGNNDKIDDATAEVLFDDFARVVCKANAIPRKELFEAWAMALYVHNHFSSNQTRRIADLACGHGLLSWALMYLDDQCPTISTTTTSSPRSAVCIDRMMPTSVEKLQLAMTQQFPDFEGRWDFVEGVVERVVSSPSTLLVGIHCCATLSDKVIDLAIASNAPLALVPCCHTRKCLSKDQKENLKSILQENHTTLADFIDQNRIQRLRDAGYTIQEESIPPEITPKNRIILATPASNIVVAQDVAPLLHETVVTTAMIQHFTIPVADTLEARSEVANLSGRLAAKLRRRKLPPRLSVSVLMPHPDAVSVPDIERLIEKVVKEYKLPREEETKENGKEITKLPEGTITTFVERFGKVHSRSDGRFCRTFRITYQIDDDTGVLPQINKIQAQDMTRTVCHLIDASLGDEVWVRQLPGEGRIRDYDKPKNRKLQPV